MTTISKESMVDYRVDLKNNCGDMDCYFGDIRKWFSTFEAAQEYIKSFEDFEQDCLEITKFDRDVKIPF